VLVLFIEFLELRVMDSKFFDCLFDGDSANGVKLGMGVTGGDFWPRLAGCQNVYRGQSLAEVDFGNICFVAEPDVSQINMVNTGSDSDEDCFVLRRVNLAGQEERSFNASVCVGFGQECNAVLGLSAVVCGEGQVELCWLYNPVAQGDKCGGFNIYDDAEELVGSVSYGGVRAHKLRIEGLASGGCCFGVRAVSVDGAEGCLREVKVMLGAEPFRIRSVDVFGF
jgi:hypothetical protein